MPFKDEAPAYSPLHESEEGLSLSPPKRHGLNWTLIWRLAVLLLLATGNLAVFSHIYTGQSHDYSGPTTSPEEYALVDELPTIYKRFHWWTEYSDNNDTATDQRWEDINPAHGFIAMNREWALDNHWPDSMHLPSDDRKNVYLLEAYHMIHCLYVIRKTFWEAVNREEYTWNPPGHCFDALRQFIVCKADNTPFYKVDSAAAVDLSKPLQGYKVRRAYDSMASSPEQVDSATDVDLTKPLQGYKREAAYDSMAASPEQADSADAVDLSKPLQGYKRSPAYDSMAASPEQVVDNDEVDLTKPLQGYKRSPAYNSMASSPEQVADNGKVDLTKPLQGYKRSPAYNSMAASPEQVADNGAVDLTKPLQGY
ncbi:hypothetical protein CKM354_000612800 [Cercospora kikuchii]|uniref:Uncharacterized protein n=1 Tax=Cercospora kikuchii TaxID=84275 RepID=A0A9P3CEM3_9PEZI|nr:uncharacterized protein CKM354_000612800 [Cercospora kikuchii]GIZ42879.1 hypothetical protein CKM354_000612800 [Cercospora kikuchii]